jgi:hypothetical protein
LFSPTELSLPEVSKHRPTSGESARFHLSDYRPVAGHNFQVARDLTGIEPVSNLRESGLYPEITSGSGAGTRANPE